jgi:hypothetical protein
MAVLTTPCPDRFHQPTQSFPYRLALDDSVSTACFGPIVGNSKKVEWTLARCRGVSAGRLLELNQHRLFGMNGQAKAVEPFRQDRHDPAGVCFQLASDDEIIAKTNHKASALHPGLDGLDKPFGVAERFDKAAVQKNIEVDLGRVGKLTSYNHKSVAAISHMTR